VTTTRNQFGWSEADLEAQYKAAKSNGWLPHFRSAAAATGLAVEQLLAVGSRESGFLWRKGPDFEIVGDSGHAHGIMQLNRNSLPDAADNKAPERNVMRGARQLAANKRVLEQRMANVPADVMARAVYASYNRGATGTRLSFENHGDPDFTTAHGNYGADCVQREIVFRNLLLADAAEDLAARGW